MAADGLTTLPAPVFVNLWIRRSAKGVSYQTDVYASRDAAAADAATPGIYAYGGTLAAAPSGAAVLLDLSEHGRALRRETAADARDDSAHERGLRRGAGRPVL